MTAYRNAATGSITANGGYVELDFRNHANGGVGVQLTGTWTGTVTWQVSMDGATFVSTMATPVTTGTDAVSTTANGVFRFEAVGIKKARATATASWTGTAVVTMVGMVG